MYCIDRDVGKFAPMPDTALPSGQNRRCCRALDLKKLHCPPSAVEIIHRDVEGDVHDMSKSPIGHGYMATLREFSRE
jgi:hypothetical protein